MDPHGVDVLDGADDDHVVLEVAHDLELELLPADHALLEQHLVGRRGVEAGLDHRVELLVGGRHPSPVAAESEAGPDDERQAEPLLEGHPSLGHALDNGAVGHAQPDRGHGLAEFVPGLGPVDRGIVGADQLDAILLEGAVLGERHGQVERCLAPEGGKQSVRPLDLDDLGHHFGNEGLDVGAVRERGVGHDGGRVRIDQHHLEALLHKHLAGLGAGVVELAGLADDDGTGTKQEDLADIGAAGHASATLPFGLTGLD